MNERVEGQKFRINFWDLDPKLTTGLKFKPDF